MEGDESSKRAVKYEWKLQREMNGTLSSELDLRFVARSLCSVWPC
jgi:hypothetical protein